MCAAATCYASQLEKKLRLKAIELEHALVNKEVLTAKKNELERVLYDGTDAAGSVQAELNEVHGSLHLLKAIITGAVLLAVAVTVHA